jgi:hypothetical protein
MTPKPLERPEWQPMQDAPRDVSELILALMPSGGLRILMRAAADQWVDVNDEAAIHDADIAGWSPVPLVPIELLIKRRPGGP